MTMAFTYPIVYALLQVCPQWSAHICPPVGIRNHIPLDSNNLVTPQVLQITNFHLTHPSYPNRYYSPSIMSLATPPSVTMDVDDLIDNNESISTKVCEKTVNICNQLPDEEVQLASTAYTGLFGHGQPFFHEDLFFFTCSATQMLLQGHSLDEDQTKSCNEVGLSTSAWIGLLPKVFHNDDDTTQFLSNSNLTRFKVIMSRLSYTPPNSLFQVSQSSTDPTNASRAWSAAHLALGSWHA